MRPRRMQFTLLELLRQTREVRYVAVSVSVAGVDGGEVDLHVHDMYKYNARPRKIQVVRGNYVRM